jgi:flagellar biosynthesis GTPase FlhF
MSTTTAEPAIADGPAAPAPAPAADPELRTYRGRTLEELLPKIRDELGPDAIVVRQRDGLMGGIGGFFQQRFVEIEARRGHTRVDVYDEPPAAEDFAAQLAVAEELAGEPLVSAPFADALPQAAEAAFAAAAPEPAPAPAAAAPAPAAAAPEPAPAASAPAAAASAPAAAASAPAAAAPEPAPAPPPPAAVAPLPVTDAPPEPAAEPAPPAADFASALPVAARPDAEVAAPQPVAAPEAAPEPPAPAEPAAAAPAEHPELIATLVAHGISDAFACELVAGATAHLLPLMGGGDVRAATAAALARRIPLAPLPIGRANARAVAFVGAPGAGKTRCAAALAAAHAQAGQVVRVVALDAEDDGAELTRLLASHGVEVHSAGSPSAARAALEGAPADALVVLDTPAVAPGDADGVARLAERLARIGVPATQVALPATLSAAAAREQLDRLAPLRPAALTLTHADATDHVGAIVELACTTALPLAHVADGRPLPGGLRHADPAELAERLLR